MSESIFLELRAIRAFFMISGVSLGSGGIGAKLSGLGRRKVIQPGKVVRAKEIRDW
jgi:hypothetical protein